MPQPAHCLFDRSSQFYKYGFQVFHGDKNDWLRNLREPFESYIRHELSAFLERQQSAFSLERYHCSFPCSDEDRHHAFVSCVTRKIPPSVIDPNCEYIKLIKDVAESLTKKKFIVFNDTIEFRVVRPNQPDNNLFHRDHWFPYFKPLLNIYVPLAGSFYDSVLKVVPGSHLWSDEDVEPTHSYGDSKRLGPNGIYYSTPTIKTSRKAITEHRPDVILGDFMLFSPMIIHGAGSNASDSTRFSLEIRLQYNA